MNEKRNSRGKTAQLDLFDSVDVQGVGVRQGDSGAAGRGGRYQDTCGTQNFCLPDVDPRFSDLEELGLPRAWLLAARTIGMDAWLDLWRCLSSEAFNEWVRRESGGTRMPMLRSYESYARLQRNRYIRALAARGMTTRQITISVKKNLREFVTEKHVAKIIRCN